MNTLTAQAVLQTWEQWQGAHPLRRSLALLSAAWPDVDARAWGAMPVGSREAWLYTLQEALFGPELDTRAACPACADALELQLTASELRQAPADDAACAAPLHCAGYEIRWRLPSSDDLLALAELAAAPAAAADRAAVQLLLERCVIEARHDAAPADVALLPATVVDTLQREMAARDPGADTRIDIVCPACGHAFERRFDIGSYLWDGVDDWARRTLSEVHVLAGAYGWSEGQILALGAARRRHYIGLVQS